MSDFREAVADRLERAADRMNNSGFLDEERRYRDAAARIRAGLSLEETRALEREMLTAPHHGPVHRLSALAGAGEYDDAGADGDESASTSAQGNAADGSLVTENESGASQLLSTATPSGLSNPYSEAQGGWISNSPDVNAYTGAAGDGGTGDPNSNPFTDTAADAGNANAFTGGQNVNAFTGDQNTDSFNVAPAPSPSASPASSALNDMGNPANANTASNVGGPGNSGSVGGGDGAAANAGVGGNQVSWTPTALVPDQNGVVWVQWTSSDGTISYESDKYPGVNVYAFPALDINIQGPATPQSNQTPSQPSPSTPAAQSDSAAPAAPAAPSPPTAQAAPVQSDVAVQNLTPQQLNSLAQYYQALTPYDPSAGTLSTAVPAADAPTTAAPAPADATQDKSFIDELRDSRLAQGGGGFLAGVISANVPVAGPVLGPAGVASGLLKEPSPTFQWWYGAGQATAGIVQVVEGFGAIIGGGGSTGLGALATPATAGLSLALSAAGVAEVAAGAAIATQGFANVTAGLGIAFHASSLGDELHSSLGDELHSSLGDELDSSLGDELPEGTHRIIEDPNLDDTRITTLRDAIEDEPHGPNDEAHHIVASAPRAQRAQAVLDKAGIKMDSQENGVWLPRASRNLDAPRGNLTEAFTDHATLHTNEYYDFVNEQLESAYELGGPDAVEAALASIKSGLILGVR